MVGHGVLAREDTFRSWAGAQLRFAAAALGGPRLPRAVRLLSGEPRVEEALVAGLPTTLVRPGKGAAWPALFFANGATARGRHHPDVRRLALALARAGFLVLVPDLPVLRRGEFTDRTLAAAVAVAREAVERPDVRGGRVGILGVSIGTTVALLAAEDPRLAGRVSVVAGVAPYTDLRKVIHLATTGLYPEDGALVPYRASTSLPLVLARSLVAALDREDRSALEGLLPEIDGAPSDDPLEPLRGGPRDALSAEASALVEVLVNRDPGRFDALFAALAGRAEGAAHDHLRPHPRRPQALAQERRGSRPLRRLRGPRAPCRRRLTAFPT